MAVVPPEPEDRQFYLSICERYEIQVTREEYRRVMARMFRADEDDVPYSITFSTGVVNGFFVDPAKREEEVVDSGDRT
jgi:hypothetical protein